MSVVIRDHDTGLWLMSYNPDFVPPTKTPSPVTGWAEWTPNPAHAMRFGSTVEALACWRQQSRTVPLRPDGKPNRPLTAHTVSVEPAP